MKEYIKAFTGSTRTLVKFVDSILEKKNVVIDSKKEFLGDRILETFVNHCKKDLSYIQVVRTVLHGIPAIECKDDNTKGHVFLYIDLDGDNESLGEFTCDVDSLEPIFEFESYIETPELPDELEPDNGFVPNLGKYDQTKPILSEIDKERFIMKAKKWLGKKGIVGLGNDEIVKRLVEEYTKSAKDLEEEQYWSPEEIEFKDDKIASIQVILQNGNVGYIYFNEKEPNIYIPLQGNWRVLKGNRYEGTLYPPLIDQGIMTPLEIKQGVHWTEGLRRVGVKYLYEDINIPKPTVEKAYEEWLSVIGQAEEVECTRYIDPYSLKGTSNDKLTKIIQSIEEFSDITIIGSLIDKIKEELDSRGLGVGKVWTDGKSFWRILSNENGKITYEFLLKNGAVNIKIDGHNESKEIINFDYGIGSEDITIGNNGTALYQGKELIETTNRVWKEAKIIRVSKL